ncbi:MAG: prepilin-type N-terminal cleavage/methylation domain-containing protein [Verrucomicrobia bacterium]|nr:prepilin-type N-terminal cleavage/methylation domain-containing protein [Verrucomicrobiota bacterium]MDA1085670.1 prepilin-type N-terminal cleavage/methylation domain-containing protein [Verrucomicrobiota bacterium]
MDKSRNAFTLLEVAIVVAIIGLLTVLAYPYFKKARNSAQDTKFINDLRVLSENCMNQYALERGDFPTDKLPS